MGAGTHTSTPHMTTPRVSFHTRFSMFGVKNSLRTSRHATKCKSQTIWMPLVKVKLLLGKTVVGSPVKPHAWDVSVHAVVMAAVDAYHAGGAADCEP